MQLPRANVSLHAPQAPNQCTSKENKPAAPILERFNLHLHPLPFSVSVPRAKGLEFWLGSRPVKPSFE